MLALLMLTWDMNPGRLQAGLKGFDTLDCTAIVLTPIHVQRKDKPCVVPSRSPYLKSFSTLKKLLTFQFNLTHALFGVEIL